MKYEIGEYGLTRGKTAYFNGTYIQALWYVDGSASGIIYDTYEEALEVIKDKMRADEKTGRRQKCLDEGDLIIYFTAGWEEQSIYLKMHISGNYDKETLDIVHAYDDRIIVEPV